MGEYASAAGKSAQLAYGVMSAGVNAVLVVIYGLGSAFAEVGSTIMSGVAKLRDGLATVTFGGLSDSFRLAAEDARNAAQGFGDAAQAMRDKAAEALQDTANGAETARAGWDGLTAASAQASGQASASQGAFKQLAETLKEVGGDATATGQKAVAAATEQKQAADTARAAVAQLKTEYEAALAAGNVQLALEKLQAMDGALRNTATQAKLTADDIAAAFQRLGVTSSADLKLQADNAQRDYNIIKGAGTSTAADIAAAFKKSAEAAIAANNGIAPSWVTAEAGARGLEVQVDKTGKSILKAMGEGGDATRSFGRDVRASTEDLKAQAEALDDINSKYGQGKKDLAGKYDSPAGGSKVPTSSGDREAFLAGQGAQDLSLQFSLLEKIQKNTLSAADLEDAKAVVESLKVNAQTNRDLDKMGGAFSAAGTLDRAKWDSVQAQLQIFIDRQKNVAAANAQNAMSGPAPTPMSAAPAPQPVAPAASYITNISLPSGATQAVRMQDADSQSVVNDLVRQLALARGAAIR